MLVFNVVCCFVSPFWARADQDVAISYPSGLVDHWDTSYTKIQVEHDICVHHPVMATFDFRK